MRIGLNLLYLIPDVVGGTETYARGLLAGLQKISSKHDFVLFVNRESANSILAENSKFTKVVCPVCAENRKQRYLFEQIQLKNYVRQFRIDLLHSLAYTSPLFLQCPTVVSIHDLNFKAFGHDMPFHRRWMLRLFVGQAVARSTKIIVMSDFSRREILQEYPIDSKKIAVIHEAVDAGEIKNGKNDEDQPIDTRLPELETPYITAFSSVTINKNIPRLLEAFLEAKKDKRFRHKLVIIGHRFPLEKVKAIDFKSLDNREIVWTGYLSRQKVFEVLQGSDFMVFPSFYEGFGLPALEAMAAGVPLVCSNTASLPEVVGEAGVFFDPFSIQDMSEKIAQVASDLTLRKNLREKGFQNLQRFSWKQTAEQTLSVYQETMQNR